MELSRRLQAVEQFVTEGNRLADIGTDHGYVPIDLLLKGRLPSAIAMDVNEGPLRQARAHVSFYQLEDRIQLRLSDGLAALQKGEADTVLIAGMGGALTVRILEEDPRPEHLLDFVLEGFDIQITSKEDVSFFCNCSRERFERGLILLGKEELESIIADGEDIELACQFCSKKYKYTTEEVKKLLSRAKNEKS